MKLGRSCAPLLLAAAIAQARMGPPVRLRIDGYVGPPREGRNEVEDLTLRCGTEDLRFQVTEAMVLSGGGLASRVFERVRPYRPNFFVRGPESVVDPLCHAAARTSWRLVGMWRGGTRDLLVSSLEAREHKGSGKEAAGVARADVGGATCRRR